MSRFSSTQLIAAVGVLVAMLAVAQWMLAPEGTGLASTHGTGRLGLRALYLTADELALPVDRWQRPLHPLPRDVAAPAVLVIAAPALPLRPAEAEWLDGWMRDGGRLLYVADGSGDEFLERLGVSRYHACRSTDDAPDVAACFVPGTGLSETARMLVDGTPFEASSDWSPLSFDEPARASAEVLLPADHGGFAAAYFRHGEGEAVVLSDVDELMNGELADAGGTTLVMRALAHLSRGDTVWFDEYHHGHDDRPSLHASAAGFLVGTDLGGGLLQLGLVLVAAVAAAGARFGSPIEPMTATRRSALEHVDALAAAYQGAHARRRAARLLREALRLRLRLRTVAALDDWLDALALVRTDLAETIAVVRHPDALATDDALVGFAHAVDILLQEDPHAARH